MSKIYWSAAVPKMVYGLDVTPISKTCMSDLEDAHRQHARLVQGIPSNSPRPTSLATLGWITIESHIAILKLLFLWRILFLPDTSIYKRIAVMRLRSLLISVDVGKIISPLRSMFDVAKFYKMEDALKTCLVSENRDSYLDWKWVIKATVWENETIRWKMTCMLYKSLDMYRDSVTEIKMHCW